MDKVKRLELFYKMVPKEIFQIVCERLEYNEFAYINSDGMVEYPYLCKSTNNFQRHPLRDPPPILNLQ